MLPAMQVLHTVKATYNATYKVMRSPGRPIRVRGGSKGCTSGHRLTVTGILAVIEIWPGSGFME